MSVRVEPIPPKEDIKIEEKKLSRAEAIRICKDKYPKEYKWKRILALSIAIAAIALVVIPAIATGLAALSLCTFEIGLLIAGPIVLLATSILIKKIDDKTIYWSGEVARNIIKKREEKARKAAAKAQKVEVKV